MNDIWYATLLPKLADEVATIAARVTERLKNMRFKA